MSKVIGTKARNLVYLKENYPTLVPSFIVVTIEDGFENWNYVRDRLNKLAEVQLFQLTTDENYASSIEDILQELKSDPLFITATKTRLIEEGSEDVSFRTSAALEDMNQSSFAGQYESYLKQTITIESIEDNLRKCAASLYADRVVAYARKKGVKKFNQDGSVVIQQMFYGQASGVLFTENGRSEMTLSYTQSWQNLTVEGEGVESLIIKKTGDPTLLPKSLPAPVQRILEVAQTLEQALGYAVDIEWSANEANAALLQLRPITVISHDYTIEWDNTNISESYPGITLPLTYGFIRNLYSEVYPSFLRLLKVSDSRLSQNRHVFENLLGLIEGRVYYNINNWYEVVRFMPGYKYNKGFFEAMLIPAKNKTNDPPPQRSPQSLSAKIGMATATVRFVRLLLSTDRLGNGFTKNYLARYQRYQSIRWEDLSADEILRTIDHIEADFLKLWAVPILNDFRTMIFHGLLKRSFFPDAKDPLYTSLLQGIYDHTSIEPIRELAQLAHNVDIELKSRAINPANRVAYICVDKAGVDLRELIANYLKTYGGRSPGELKLENPRLAENFEEFVKFVLSSAQGSIKPISAPNDTSAEAKIVKQVMARYTHGKRLFIAPLFSFVFTRAKRGISKRERFRFYRAQVFGLARKSYLALGDRLVESNVLERNHDIFYLTKSEVYEAILGHAPMQDLGDVVKRRKIAFNDYGKKPIVRRKISYGTVAPYFTQDDVVKTNHPTNQLTGMGVSNGTFKGEAMVVKEFDPSIDLRGKILVTQQTDPGWTLLFVNAAAVVVERGNALSHASIVARELGIPAVVGVENACELIKSGQILEVNGSSGEVTIVS